MKRIIIGLNSVVKEAGDGEGADAAGFWGEGVKVGSLADFFFEVPF